MTLLSSMSLSSWKLQRTTILLMTKRWLQYIILFSNSDSTCLSPNRLLSIPIMRHNARQRSRRISLRDMTLWLFFFVGYKFEVNHKPAMQILLADMLSRWTDYDLAHITTLLHPYYFWLVRPIPVKITLYLGYLRFGARRLPNQTFNCTTLKCKTKSILHQSNVLLHGCWISIWYSGATRRGIKVLYPL